MFSETTASIRGQLRRLATSLRWAVAALAFVAVQTFAAAPSYNVVVLYSDYRLLPIVAVIDESINATLRADFGTQVDVFNDFLDLNRLPQPAYAEELVRLLREKYAGTRIDALIAARGPALDFLLAHRNEIFPGVPIVHAFITARELAGRRLPSDVIGAPIQFEPAKTLDLALRLHPKTRHVVVITGTSEFDRAWEALLRGAFRPYEQRVAVEYWAGLTLAELLSRLPRLSPDTIVYFGALLRDGNGQQFVPRQVAIKLIEVTPAPVYSWNSLMLGTGAVGGYLLPVEDIGRLAAEQVARLLKGEAPTSMATSPPVPNAYMFDARELRRFGVEESALPPGSILRYREPTLWEAYRWQISAVLALLLLQTALIAALLAHRLNRRRAEAGLRESEQRMNLVATATGFGMWMQDLPRHEFWASPQHRALLGMSESEPYNFERFLAAVHPEDREQVRQAIEAALAQGGEYDIHYRVPLANGYVRWVDSRGRVEADPSGRPMRIRGVTSDVTARKEAEFETQRHRNELAHVSRVGMLGELSGSLAHELNQPLTAILSNAQAALRFLHTDSADLNEVRDILKDIVADDRRAGDVIRRLRALYERGEAKREALDLNELIRDVLQLLRSDLVSRNVAIATDLDPRLPATSGDRVQLQQLLLNLILNACDAMAGCAPGERRLTLRTASGDGDEIVVLVADRGNGIAPDQLETIFEPFVTTKQTGIGLGLVIARSIVTAHGGRLWASNNLDRGATLSFTLQAQAGARAPVTKEDRRHRWLAPQRGSE